MARFELVQRCWPSGSFRVPEVAAFLSLIAKSCGLSWLEVPRDGKLMPTPEAVEALFRRASQEAPFPGAGADVDIYGRIDGTDDYVRFALHSGTKPGERFIDHYNVDFGESGLWITTADFRRAVEIIRPFEAFLAELNNDEDLDAYTRQQQLGFFAAPAIIRQLHYFERKLAAPVGGLEHCLKAPASRVEPFLDGVLIQLVDQPFEPANPDHLKRQQDVMRHLGIGASAGSASTGHHGALKT